ERGPRPSRWRRWRWRWRRRPWSRPLLGQWPRPIRSARIGYQPENGSRSQYREPFFSWLRAAPGARGADRCASIAPIADLGTKRGSASPTWIGLVSRIRTFGDGARGPEPPRWLAEPMWAGV